MTKQLQAPCPHCNKKIIWDQKNPFRPFCSERCKLIDLGHWADESYRLPEKNTDASIPPQESEEDS